MPSSKTRRSTLCAIAVGSALLAAIPAAGGGQTLETETARLLAHGAWKLGGTYEFQTSADGREGAMPLLAEYGLSDRVELLVEPVPYTAIHPAGEHQVTGAGDLEATVTMLVRHETTRWPAFAVAAEVKVPTARNPLIGTGETDYTGYAIASKRVGPVDTHANVSYTIMGSPAGISLNNIWSGALAAVYRPTRRWELFGETLGSTAAAPEGEAGDSQGPVAPVVPEAAGAELVGTLGAGRFVASSVLLYGAVSYDNTHATQLRTGVTLWSRPR
jgi:hypothetical protein